MASGAKKTLHPQMARVYEALRLVFRTAGRPTPTRVASELNISPQMINNWDARGPSKTGLLAIQAKFGVNATFVETGEGPMLVAERPAIRPPVAELREPDPPAYTIGFPDVDMQKLARLPRDQLLQLQGALLLAAGQLGLDLRKRAAA